MTTSTNEFWAGQFGNDYARRNQDRVAANIALFGRILAMTENLESVVEFGCGTGQNLEAIHHLMPDIALTGVEINQHAASLCRVGEIHVRPILDPELHVEADMAITKGVLIHQHPDTLHDVYQRLYSAARRYILVAEYYNPTPVEVEYRGHAGKLWKRDFAGELLDRYPGDLTLLDCGFAYHRGPFPQDDITYFLLEKQT